MEEKNSLFTWIKEHKTELIVLGVTAIGTIIVVKNWDSIKSIFKSYNSIPTPTIKIKPVVENVTVPVIPSDSIYNLTGNKLTATELGSKVLCSAQSINKRIVAAGLATKLPYDGYSFKEAGSLLVVYTSKTTRGGYSFSNIEWDEKILEGIFSAEELAEIADKHKVINEILSRYAA